MSLRWPTFGLLLVGILTTVMVPAKEEPRGFEKDAITLGVTAEMDFGSLADHDGYVEIGPSDNILADPQNIFFGGVPYSAVITVGGDPPLAGVSLGTTGQIELYVGGRLTVDSTSASPGDDEIIYVIRELPRDDDVRQLAEGILAELSKPHDFGGEELAVSASLGLHASNSAGLCSSCWRWPRRCGAHPCPMRHT
mgnify:CR=1 FL=1